MSAARDLSPAASAVLDALPGRRLVVVGDVVLDEWFHGTCSAVAREAPVPNVDISRHDAVGGCAANTAANAASMGGHVSVVGVTGRDEAGERLRSALGGLGVGTEGLLEVAERVTRAKRRIVADGQVLARFDEGDTGPVPPAVDAALAARLEDLAADAEVLVVADYGGGAVDGPALRRVLARLARRIPVVVDAHDPRRWCLVHPTVVTPNWGEAQRLLGPRSARAEHRAAEVVAGASTLLRESGASAALVTLDSDGAVLVGERLAAVHLPTQPLGAAHVAGAGDTVAAVLGLGLAAGAPLPVAAELAVAAGTFVAGRPGTALCRRRDLGRVVSDLSDVEDLMAAVAEHRASGRRIAFTNGCFDVLHAGHVACLSAAARFGDVVVVGLNDDAGVRHLKGPGRPVNGLQDRASVLAALGTVDHICAFPGTAPLPLIQALRPDVYVKGADHDVEALPESHLVRELGGRVVTVPLLPQRSTSQVIAACATAVRSGSR